MITNAYLEEVLKRREQAHCKSCGGTRVLRKDIADKLIEQDIPNLIAAAKEYMTQYNLDHLP